MRKSKRDENAVRRDAAPSPAFQSLTIDSNL
jgi:hypothetical protein